MKMKITGRFEGNIIKADGHIIPFSLPNAIVDEGKNLILDTMFTAETQYTWYCGLVETFTVQSASDTMASHAGWVEYQTYDETVRQTWVAGAAVDKSVENPTTSYMEFTIDDATSPTLDGFFITSVDTKGGTTGKLWCTANFTTPPEVADNDVIQVQYIVTIA